MIRIISALLSSSAVDAGVPFYIAAGQSNMGRSRTSQMTAGEQANYAGLISNAQIINPAANSNNYSSATFQPLNVGVNTLLSNANNTDEFGFEASFGKQMAAYKGKEIRVLKYGVGNTDLYNQWAPNSTFRANLFTVMERAAQLAQSEGKKLSLKGVIWMQGENDATNQTWANAYGVNLSNMMAAILSQWQSICSVYGHSYDAGTRKIIGRINGVNDSSEVYRATVRQAQADYCSNSANNATLIDTDGYPQLDIVHYSATGQIQFGTDIFNSLKNL